MVTKNFRRTLISVAGLSLLATTASSCGLGAATIGTRVPPDKVALLINQYGDESSRGIQNAELFRDGRVSYNPTTYRLELFDKALTSYTFSDDPGVESTRREAIRGSVGGTQVSEDIGISARVPSSDDGEALKAYMEAHGKPFAQFVTNDLFRATGDCLNEVIAQQGIKTPGDYLASRALEIADGVQSCLNAKFPYVEISSISILGTPAWTDAAIQEQISARQASVERAEKALQDKVAAEAEAAAQLAKTRGEVEAQKARAELLNNPAYVELRRLDQEDLRLEIEKIEAEKWNGVRPAPVNVTGANAQVVGGAAQ